MGTYFTFHILLVIQVVVGYGKVFQMGFQIFICGLIEYFRYLDFPPF